MKRTFFVLVSATALASALVSCGDDPAPRTEPGGDAGPPLDASEPPDAAELPDAADARDASPPMDGSGGDDAGPILPPRDAGDPFGDAGPLGPPSWTDLDVLDEGMCEPLVACGGDETGTWDVGGGCIEVPVPEQLMRCPGAAVTRRAGRARGRVTFASGVADRTAQWEVEVELFVPSFCASFVGGCDAITSTLRGVVPDSACRAEGEGDCRCAARQSGSIDDGDAYRIEANQIVSITSGKRWDYCVEDTRLRYRDVSAEGMLEPGIITLEQR